LSLFLSGESENDKNVKDLPVSSLLLSLRLRDSIPSPGLGGGGAAAGRQPPAHPTPPPSGRGRGPCKALCSALTLLFISLRTGQALPPAAVPQRQRQTRLRPPRRADPPALPAFSCFTEVVNLF